MNVVILSGNLGSNPEVKYLASSQAVANFSLATTERWRDKSTNEKCEETTWHQVVAWGRTAEICGEFLAKGSRVNIIGRIKQESWDDRETGAKRHATKIVVTSLEMVGGGSRIREDEKPKVSQPDDDDIPF